MWGRIMKLPNIKILDEKEKILHKKALPVTEFPISKEDQKNIEDMITYLTMSQIEEYSEKYDLRPGIDRKSTRLNSSHTAESRMPSSA